MLPTKRMLPQGRRCGWLGCGPARRWPGTILHHPRITRDLLEWRDSLASSPRQADYAWTVLMRIISWARGRGLTTYRPPDRVDNLYHSDPADKVWEAQHIAEFQKVAALPPTNTLARPRYGPARGRLGAPQMDGLRRRET